MIEAFLGVFVFLIVVALVSSIRIMNARRFAIVERMGQFSRVAWPGVHFLWPFFESFRTVRWSYVGQNGHTRIHEANTFSFDECALDIAPLTCRTKDQFLVTVDGIAYYKITDLTRAVYESSDALNRFFQCLQQAVRNVVGNALSSDLNGSDTKLGAAIVQTTNELLNHEKHGIVCSNFLMQSATMDPKVVESNQRLAAERAQQELQRQKLEAEHETQLRQVAMQIALQQKQAQLAMEKQQAQDRVEDERVRAQCNRFAMDFDLRYRQQGFSTEDYIRMREIEALEHVNENAKRIVYAPLDYWKTSGSLKVNK
jgi:regulator of protease activity HflC (stomatin/prohibitin superfamily)